MEVQELLNRINRYENVGLLAWTTLIILYKGFGIGSAGLVIALSAALDAFYYLQGSWAFREAKDQPKLVRAYSMLLGIASAMMVLGVLFRTMAYAGDQFFLYSGMAAILLSTLALFHNPIQDAYLPIMKKILLRLMVLIVLGFWSAM